VQIAVLNSGDFSCVEMTVGSVCFFFDAYESPEISPGVEMTAESVCFFLDPYEGREISPASK